MLQTILYNLVHPHERLFEPPNIYANQWSCVPANISSGLPNPNCSLDCPAGTYCGLGYFGYWGPYENRSILVVRHQDRSAGAHRLYGCLALLLQERRYDSAIRLTLWHACAGLSGVDSF